MMTGSNIEPHDKKVETSSENEEIHPVLSELSHSSHSSNGEGDSLECSSHSSNEKGGSLEPCRDSSSSIGGPPDPCGDSSSSAGGPPDPYQDSFSTMGGPPDPHANNSLSVEPHFDENSYSSKIELDLEALEECILNQGLNLKDDSSYSSESHASKPTDSSYSSESCAFKPTDLSSYDRIDRIIANASKDLDRLADEIFCLDFKEQGSYPHPSPISEHEDIFKHVLVEPLPQLDMKPYFFEEKRKPESNHLPLKKRFV